MVVAMRPEGRGIDVAEKNPMPITGRELLDSLKMLSEANRLRAEAERTRANLARYFPAHLADSLGELDEPFGPPRHQRVAILFADIRGFTRLSEAMAPTEVMEILRRFHRCMEGVVFEHGGTVDNYIGDAQLVTFGVPKIGPADATAALTCAREMLRAMVGLNEAFMSVGRPALGIGIGVHYGPVVLGDIGSERSMRFAVIGDTVNAACRLERLTRTLDVDLVASRTLVDRVRAEARAGSDALLADLTDAGAPPIRGRSGRIPVLTLPRDFEHATDPWPEAEV